MNARIGHVGLARESQQNHAQTEWKGMDKPCLVPDTPIACCNPTSPFPVRLPNHASELTRQLPALHLKYLWSKSVHSVNFASHFGAMEVLPRALAARTRCSSSQSSSLKRQASSSSSSSSSPTRLPLAASLLASSCSLITSSVPTSLALSYEDLLNKTPTPSIPDSFYNAVDSFFFVDFDAATDFMTTNPVAFLAGLAAVAVPLIAFTAVAIPQTFGSVSAVDAYETLSSQPNAQLLDVRLDVKAEGSPSLKALKKKVVQVRYNTGDDADAFVAEVLAKFKDPAATTLYILDRMDENSLTVAKLLANNGFEGAFAIKGGVEGPNGWKSNELPWLPPRKAFSFNLDGLKDILNGSDTSNLVPTALGVAAAAGVGAAVFTEAESALQLLGSAAFIQVFVKKFMFAKDREKTIKDVSTFLNTKVAPKDFADELKEVGRVLIPKDAEVKAAVKSGEKVLQKTLKGDAATPQAVAGKVA